jgi:hypothetical protein
MRVEVREFHRRGLLEERLLFEVRGDKRGAPVRVFLREVPADGAALVQNKAVVVLIAIAVLT